MSTELPSHPHAESSFELILVSQNHTPGAVPDRQANAVLLADGLLAPLAADLYRHQRRERGISAMRIRETVVGLADAVVGSWGPDPRRAWTSWTSHGARGAEPRGDVARR